jgi:hypothetical protein
LPVAEAHVPALVQEMTISRESFLRLLPAAVDNVPFDVAGTDIRSRDDGRGWHIVLTPLSDMRLGRLALPRHRVAFHFTGYGEDDRRRFLERFELYYRRCGG